MRVKKLHSSIRTAITDMSEKPLDRLAAKHLGDLVVLGKDDALVFTADVVAISLHYHLGNLPPDAPLNHPYTAAGWLLNEECTAFAMTPLKIKSG